MDTVMQRGRHTGRRASQVVLVVKNPPASAGEIRDPGLGSKEWDMTKVIHKHAEREGNMKRRERTASYKPRRFPCNRSFPQFSGKTRPAVLDFQHHETINFCGLSHPLGDSLL